MELNTETVQKALDWLDSLVGNSNDSDIALLTYQLLGILYNTCDELTEQVEWRKNQYLSLVESHNRTCDYLNTKEVEMAKLTEENERLRAEISDLKDELKCEKETNAHLCSQYMSENHLRYQSEEMLANAMSVVKADTVRKMQSEIKERCIKGGIYPAFVASTIDQIAKEMLEGTDEKS